MENDTPNNLTVEERLEKDKQAVFDALKETPIVAVACKKAGIGRATYYRWRKEDKQFLRHVEDAMAQGFELINDLSEGQIVTLIKEKKMPAITLWLKHHHPRYGSKAKQYTPIAAHEDLTPEEQKIFLEALSLASEGVSQPNNNDENNPTTSGTSQGEPTDQTASSV
ncbi:MAG TPA: hypothetical protein ACFYEK_12815 [Candidatus Wunengus sp. YC60]|uniref:hypothetical protein n=1 Tax=Candidatus Wunengus sp. YC60 TaxID=3367697 RepID=UPI004026A311